MTAHELDPRTGEVLGSTRLPTDQVRITRRTIERRIVRHRSAGGLRTIHRLILTILEDSQISRYGRSDLTVKEIALEAACCARTVRYRMRDLEEWGYVEVRERAGRRGGQLANTYRVRTPKGPAKSPEAAAERRRRRRERDEARKTPRPPVENRRRPRGGDCNPAHPPGPTAPRVREIAPSGSGDDHRAPPVPGACGQPPPHPAAADPPHGQPRRPNPRREEAGRGARDFRSAAELLAHLRAQQAAEGPNPGPDP